MLMAKKNSKLTGIVLLMVGVVLLARGFEFMVLSGPKSAGL